MNVALDLPAGTVTVAGTVADGSELVSLITKPPVGAGPVNVTVPVTAVVALPLTVVGVTLSDFNLAARTVIDAR